MDAIGEQRALDTGRRTLLGKTDPHFPIFGISQPGIERTDTLPRGAAHDHVRTPTWNRIVSGQYRHDLVRSERRTAVNDVTLIRDVDASRIDPVATCARRHAELLCQ